MLDIKLENNADVWAFQKRSEKKSIWNFAHNEKPGDLVSGESYRANKAKS